MGNFEIHRTENYIVMGNYHLKEPNLSLKAKGLMSLMLSLPKNWNYSISGLKNICIENETALKSALLELKELGYLRIEKLMPNITESKKIEYVYHIYEKPQKQGVGFLGVENQVLENHTLNNTNKDINNKDISLKENIKESASDLDFLTGIPTLQEVQEFIVLKEYKFDAEDFYNYYSAIGWKKNGIPIKDWHYVAMQWGKRANMNSGLKDIAEREKNKAAIQNRNYTQDQMNNIFENREVSDDDI